MKKDVEKKDSLIQRVSFFTENKSDLFFNHQHCDVSKLFNPIFVLSKCSRLN